MLFRKKSRYGPRRRIDFFLEEERSRARASGFGLDEFVRIKDDSGNVWTGIVEFGAVDEARYYLSDAAGRRISGFANRSSMVFRDDQGRTWKGFAE